MNLNSITLLDLFGAPKISYAQIEKLLNDAPEIIIWAAPFLFFFVLLEWYISFRQKKSLYTKDETIGSALVGIGNVVIAFALKFILFYIFILAYNTVSWRMYFNWWTLVPCYVILDFFSYWAHRISHTQRFWWATHVVHHSSENFNLSVSFRLSWVQHLKIIFILPVSFLGFHPVIIFIVNQLAVLFQFWVHTEYIGRLPKAFEFIFATPSNHRVHHGMQKKYRNKNFGATFMIWDRLFGTYQNEEEQVKYGTTHNIKYKVNPIYINFHEFVEIWKDIIRARSFKKKWFYLFGDPGLIEKEKLSESVKDSSSKEC